MSNKNLYKQDHARSRTSDRFPLNGWEIDCLNAAEDSNVRLSESSEREIIDFSKKLWTAFQNSAECLSQLYKDGCQNRSTYVSFQSAASAVTALYRESLDMVKRSHGLAIELGRSEQVIQLLPFLRRSKRYIRREDLIAELLHKSPPPKKLPSRHSLDDDSISNGQQHHNNIDNNLRLSISAGSLSRHHSSHSASLPQNLDRFAREAEHLKIFTHALRNCSNAAAATMILDEGVQQGSNFPSRLRSSSTSYRHRNNSGGGSNGNVASNHRNNNGATFLVNSTNSRTRGFMQRQRNRRTSRENETENAGLSLSLNCQNVSPSHTSVSGSVFSSNSNSDNNNLYSFGVNNNQILPADYSDDDDNTTLQLALHQSFQDSPHFHRQHMSDDGENGSLVNNENDNNNSVNPLKRPYEEKPNCIDSATAIPMKNSVDSSSNGNSSSDENVTTEDESDSKENSRNITRIRENSSDIDDRHHCKERNGKNHATSDTDQAIQPLRSSHHQKRHVKTPSQKSKNDDTCRMNYVTEQAGPMTSSELSSPAASPASSSSSWTTMLSEEVRDITLRDSSSSSPKRKKLKRIDEEKD